LRKDIHTFLIVIVYAAALSYMTPHLRVGDAGARVKSVHERIVERFTSSKRQQGGCCHPPCSPSTLARLA
jgi:hypothetical protein